MGSPPLARGILARSTKDLLEIGITPACAGNTILVLVSKYRNRDHPRLRGEYLLRQLRRRE